MRWILIINVRDVRAHLPCSERTRKYATGLASAMTTPTAINTSPGSPATSESTAPTSPIAAPVNATAMVAPIGSTSDGENESLPDAVIPCVRRAASKPCPVPPGHRVPSSFPRYSSVVALPLSV